LPPPLFDAGGLDAGGLFVPGALVPTAVEPLDWVGWLPLLELPLEPLPAGRCE
jgi:hypothetical protein